jgi:hypothetical protein
MIARFASMVRGLAVDAHPSDGVHHMLTKTPLHGLVL